MTRPRKSSQASLIPDDATRLRELLTAMSSHVRGIRVEWMTDQRGNGRIIVTHSMGQQAEQDIAALVAAHLRMSGETGMIDLDSAKDADTGEPFPPCSDALPVPPVTT